MRRTIAYSVDDLALLPTDAAFLAASFYGPLYTLASGAVVIVDPRAPVDTPGLPSVTRLATRLLGADASGDPVYALVSAGHRATDVVAIPSLEGPGAPPITQGRTVQVPIGSTLAGIDPLAGPGLAVFVDGRDPTRFFVPGRDTAPTGTALETVTLAPPAPTTTPAPTGSSLADHQKIWLAPVDPLTRQGLLTQGGIDFDDLISPHSAWTGIGRSVDVLSIYGYFFLAATDEEIRQLLRFVAANGLELAVQSGAVTIRPDGLGTGVEGFIQGTELHDIAARIAALGGRADDLVLDEPGYFPALIGVPLDATVRSAVDNVQQFLAVFPNAKIGDQEPVGGYVDGAAYAQFTAAWRAYAGRGLDFVQLDVDWTNPAWRTDMAGVDAVARAAGEAVTVIVNGAPGDTTSQAWTAHAVANAIAIGTDPTLRPDAAVFQSFVSTPGLIGSPTTPDSLGGEVGAYLATPDRRGPATPAAIAANAPASPAWHQTFDAAGALRSTAQTRPDGTSVTVTFDPRGYADQVTRSASGILIAANSNEPFFDAAYYLATYGATLPAGQDPLLYFETTGWQLGQRPSAAFDTSAYRRAAGTIDGNPLQDFEARSLWTSVSPSALFDPAYYAAHNPDVVAASVGLFQHFLRYGWADGRDPGPLLSIGFYTGQHGAGSVSADPLIDYAAAGWRLGLDPSPVFDTSYYLARYPDVAASGMDPLTEFLTTGWTLGRTPTPWFDPAYYLAHNPDVAAAGLDPLLHFLEIGWTQGRDPSAAFSIDGYLATYPGIAASGLDPLIHFLQYGQAEGYVPIPATAHQTTADPAWHIDGAFAQQSTTDDRPLQPFSRTVLRVPVTGQTGTVQITLADTQGHATDTTGTLSGPQLVRTGTGTYVVQGSADGLTQAIEALVFTPAPGQAGTVVETDFTLALVAGGTGSDSTASVLVRHAAPPATYMPSDGDDDLGQDPDGLFDRAYYLANNPDVAASGMDPLQHYVQFGWREGRNPNPLFDTRDYLARYPDVAAAGLDPLIHFEQSGWREGRDPSPLFDTSLYLRQNPDVAAAGLDPLRHFEQFGWLEGRHPDAWFDPGYYLAHNPDVAAAGLNPLIHFEAFGWREGRDPSAAFSTRGYLAAYADVGAAGLNPLVHYLAFGRAEGRTAFAA